MYCIVLYCIVNHMILHCLSKNSRLWCVIMSEWNCNTHNYHPHLNVLFMLKSFILPIHNLHYWWFCTAFLNSDWLWSPAIIFKQFSKSHDFVLFGWFPTLHSLCNPVESLETCVHVGMNILLYNIYNAWSNVYFSTANA